MVDDVPRRTVPAPAASTRSPAAGRSGGSVEGAVGPACAGTGRGLCTRATVSLAAVAALVQVHGAFSGRGPISRPRAGWSVRRYPPSRGACGLPPVAPRRPQFRRAAPRRRPVRTTRPWSLRAPVGRAAPAGRGGQPAQGPPPGNATPSTRQTVDAERGERGQLGQPGPSNDNTAIGGRGPTSDQKTIFFGYVSSGSPRPSSVSR